MNHHYDLPAAFEEFNEARKNGFLTIKQLKEEGKNVVGIFCTYTPSEILIAAKATVVGLCSTNDETIPEAEKHLPRNLCPLIKASYGFAITDKCPYMYFSDLIVGETTCDGKKKMYEMLSDIKNVHVMQLPQRQNDEKSKELWYEEILMLKKRVEEDFHVTITDEDIRNAIKIKNTERSLMKEFYELSTLCPPPISGLEQLRTLFGSQFKFIHEEKVKEIREIIDNIKENYEKGNRKISEKAKRILITGCPMGGVSEKVVQIIEDLGAVVVVFENCTGTKQMNFQVDENAADPYKAIADRYLQIGCSIMTPNDNRLRDIDELIDQFKVDAVVEMTLQACHTYNIESSEVKKHLEGKGVPFISVETDYSTSDVAQLKTRIGAFLEILQ